MAIFRPEYEDVEDSEECEGEEVEEDEVHPVYIDHYVIRVLMDKVTYTILCL